MRWPMTIFADCINICSFPFCPIHIKYMSFYVRMVEMSGVCSFQNTRATLCINDETNFKKKEIIKICFHTPKKLAEFYTYYHKYII